MGLHLPPKATLKGHKVKDIQKTLNTFGFIDTDPETKDLIFKTAPNVEHRSFTKAHQDRLSLMLKEGLAVPNATGPFDMTLTDEGDALRTAALYDRVPLNRADRAFEDLKHAVEDINEERAFEVEEVWLQGSYMRREAAIGDIDASIIMKPFDSLESAENVLADYHAEDDWYEDEIKKNGFITPERYGKETLSLFATEPALLDNVEFGDRNLKHMPGPFQRVYTKEDGWVTEPPVAEYPKAAERQTLKPQVTLTIDQGTFSSKNEGTNHLSKEDVRKAKIKAAAAANTPTPLPKNARDMTR